MIAPKFPRSARPSKLAPRLLHEKWCHSGVGGRHLGAPLRGMRATEICELQINGAKLGSGGRESGVGGGEASIVSDPGVQWEIERGAGRVTQLFAADSFLPTAKTRGHTECTSLETL